MSREAKKKLQDRVVLIYEGHGTSRENPVKKSKYGCAGTVSRLSDEYIHVDWDNGARNVYYHTDLDFEAPTHIGSIWDT